jgi:putative multicomponent Na+:H+ antiporter subunit B
MLNDLFSIENIALLLQIILILVALFIVFHEKNFTIIVLISVFSLVAATLYTLNQAPDVAIAEVAIGSAIIPLIYVISISRQREFIVLDKSRHGFIDPDEELEGIVYDILNEFVATYDLRLNVCCDIEGTEQELTTQLNVDLIISLDPQTKRFVLKGKASSVLMSKLSKICETHPEIDVEVLKAGDPLD